MEAQPQDNGHGGELCNRRNKENNDAMEFFQKTYFQMNLQNQMAMYYRQSVPC